MPRFMTSSDVQNGICYGFAWMGLFGLYGINHIIRNKSSQVKFMRLTSAQIRAARALVRWSAQDLARESAVGVTTIRRAELTKSETSMTAANSSAIRRALEEAGVEFIDENGGGPGVRLRQREQKKA